MRNLFNFLENTVSPGTTNTPLWVWILFTCLLTIPWIALIIYIIILKYRVRVFADGIKISDAYLKAGQSISKSIVLPYKEGYTMEMYKDPEFVLPLDFDQMPKSNIKIYIKWIKNE